MEFPKEALEILERLEDRGWEAWIVGGAVRDALFSHPLHDVDITTAAHPDQIMACFSDCKTITVGKAFGTVRVLYGKKEYEITSYRSESGYADKRHPDQVSYAGHIEEDLKRRDFTMNAMAYHPQRGLLDLFGGKEDYEKGLLRAVGEANERMDEDGLRMLRACRFAARFSLTLDPDLFSAIKAHALEIHLVSMERCLDEMTRMLTGPHPDRALFLLQETGLFDVLFPEWGTFQEEGESRLTHLPADSVFRWAGFFAEREDLPFSCRGKQAKETLKKWKASRKLQDQVAFLIIEEKAPLPQTLRETIYWEKRLGPMAKDLLTFREAKISAAGQKAGCMEAESLQKERRDLQKTRAFLQEIEEKALPTAIQDLALSGKDLKEMGWKEGRDLGETLLFLFDLVASGKIQNQKKALEEKARAWQKGGNLGTRNCR